jgi:hypothetical protein
LAEQELVSTEESSPQNELSELRSAEAELEPQERMFCYGYLTDYDHRRAAVDVGRSPDAGRKLLRNPKIARFIRLLGDELAAESLVTRDMVQYELLHGYLPRARGDVPICGVDRDGLAWSGKVTNMAAYGKALEIMSKHSGFTAAEVVAGGLTININHKAMGITVEGEYSEQRVSEKESSEKGSET